MTISYNLAPEPKWYFADFFGKALSDGKLFTFRSINKTETKLVYQTASNATPWPNPIDIDLNGTQGPFYFQTDSTNPTDTYYLVLTGPDGDLNNPIWTIDNFFPPGSGGGGSVVQTFNLNNLIINGEFWRHCPPSPSPIGVTNFLLAPSNHDGFSTITGGSQGDIRLIKDNNMAVDQIQVKSFVVSDLPFYPDVTPENYLSYTCSTTPTETDKYVQFPIQLHLKNLDAQQNLSYKIWGRSNVGTQNVVVKFMQFLGDGPAASIPNPVFTTLGTLNLTSTWTGFSDTINIPSLTGLTLGECGNDALYLTLHYPLSTVCDIDLAKISLYLGPTPIKDWTPYDQIESIINSPRTGDARLVAALGSLSVSKYVEFFSWIQLQQAPTVNTIGDGSSGATYSNVDSFPLFDWIWLAFPMNALYNNSGSLITRPADAITAFLAHDRLQLPFRNVLSPDIYEQFIKL